MNIIATTFTAIARNTYRGCICEHKPMAECHAMNAHAATHGLPDCDGSPDAQGYIFVASDGELFGMVQQSEATPAVTGVASKQKTQGE